MYEVVLLNLSTNSKFTKVFNSIEKFTIFVNRVHYSNKLKILSIINNSYMFD